MDWPSCFPPTCTPNSDKRSIEALRQPWFWTNEAVNTNDTCFFKLGSICSPNMALCMEKSIPYLQFSIWLDLQRFLVRPAKPKQITGTVPIWCESIQRQLLLACWQCKKYMYNKNSDNTYQTYQHKNKGVSTDFWCCSFLSGFHKTYTHKGTSWSHQRQDSEPGVPWGDGGYQGHWQLFSTFPR